MQDDSAPTDPDAYTDWLKERVGAELRRQREARGLSAYALGKVAKVSDQTILNIEQGKCERGSVLATMARVARQFEMRLWEFLRSAEEAEP